MIAIVSVSTLSFTFTSISRLQKLENFFDSSTISSHVEILDLNEVAPKTFRCLTTKTLLANITTKICLYDSKRDVYVSAAYREKESIWEETEVTHLLRLFRLDENLHFIDIGAHVGTYTMFVAALGRFVLSVDCFRPNLVRLRHAIQLTQMTNRVVLINNAIYSQSGQKLKLAINTRNIGGQGLYVTKTHSNRSVVSTQILTNHSYTVKTIRFDDLRPILMSKRIEKVLIKIDIEGSENFVLESGEMIFNQFDIPLVQMEWSRTRLYSERVETILKFFAKRKFLPTNDRCETLDQNEYQKWPKDIYWLNKQSSNFCLSVHK